MLNRTLAPEFQNIKEISLIQPESISYPNGLKVFVFQQNDIDLLKFEFIFANVLLEEELATLNPILSSMLKEGTKTLSSREIADTIDFYGAYLMPEYSYDQTSLTVYTMHKYVGKILPLLADILQNSILPQAELDTYIRNNKQNLQISLQKNDVLARRNFYKEVFKGTRYGVIPTESTFDSVRREQLLTLYNSQVRPDNCTLFVAGRVTDEIAQMIATLFGNEWSNNTAVVDIKVPEFKPASTDLKFEQREDSLQSAIRMGCQIVNRRHPDFPAIQFVNTLYGGFFGSRLMKNIREEKGYTYSIGSYIGNLKYTAFMTLATEVGVDVTPQTIQEIHNEFDILRQEKTAAEEIELVKNYMQGSLLGSLESIFSHVDKFKKVYFSGLTTEYYHYYSQMIQQMDGSKVQDIAIKYFDYDKLFKVVVGKM